MQQLNSSNYTAVYVTLRSQDELIKMDATNGTKLMEYLVAENKSTHVGLTDVDGGKVVVRVTDIVKVEPSKSLKELSNYV